MARNLIFTGDIEKGDYVQHKKLRFIYGEVLDTNDKSQKVEVNYMDVIDSIITYFQGWYFISELNILHKNKAIV